MPNLAIGILGVSPPPGGGGFDPDNTVIVAKGGTGGVDSNTIQGAIDSITDASAAKPYTVLVFPGTYIEDLMLQPFVSLYGLGDTLYPVQVVAAAGAAITLPNVAAVADAGLTIKGITFISAQDAPMVNLPAGMGSFFFRNCMFLHSVDNLAQNLVEQAAGELFFDGCELLYNMDGNTGGASEHNVFSVTAEADLSVKNCRLSANIEDPTGTVNIIHAANAAISISFDNNICRSYTSGARTCLFVFTESTLSGDEQKFTGNYVELSAPGFAGQATTYLIDSGGNNSEVRSVHNVYEYGTVAGTENLVIVANGDALYSRLDYWGTNADPIGLGTFENTSMWDPDNMELAGRQNWTGVLTPAQITANQNNYNPTGLDNAAIMHLDSNGSYNITGITAPPQHAEGRILVIYNTNQDKRITLMDQDGASLAANRFALGGKDFVIEAGQCVILQYDDVNNNWRIIGSSHTGGGESIIKGWIQFSGQGIVAIQDSYNVSSIADNGAGNYTVFWDTDFANNDYACVTTYHDNSILDVWTPTSLLAAASAQVFCWRSTLVGYDPDFYSVMAIGDQ